MLKKKITFVMPCYNESCYTKKCINSIIKNSPQDSFNFIFINNGSTDDTNDFLKTIENSTIIQNEHNLYVNPAWNQGFKHLLEMDTGEYVCLCNNDIIAGFDWLQPIFDLFEKRKNEFYVPVSNTQLDPLFHGEDELLKYSFSPKPLMLSYIREPFVGFCMFMRTTHVPLFYPIPEVIKVLHGDDWITDTLFSNGIVPIRVNRCAVYHVGGGTQRNMPIDEMRNNDHN